MPSLRRRLRIASSWIGASSRRPGKSHSESSLTPVLGGPVRRSRRRRASVASGSGSASGSLPKAMKVPSSRSSTSSFLRRTRRLRGWAKSRSREPATRSASFEAIVAEQTAQQPHPLARIERVDVPTHGRRRHDQGRDDPLAGGPGEEDADAVGLAGCLREPVVEVLLAQPLEGEAAIAEPDQQVGGDADLGARIVICLATGAATALGGGELGLDLPGGEPTQGESLRARRDPLRLAGDEGPKRGRAAVVLGQDAVAHQRRPQELGALTALEAVERLMVERQLASQQLDQRLVAAAFADPAQHGLRLGVLGERLEVGAQRRDGRRVAIPRQLVEAPAQGAAHAETGEVVDLLGAAALADLAHLLAGAALADRRVDQ